MGVEDFNNPLFSFTIEIV